MASQFYEEDNSEGRRVFITFPSPKISEVMNENVLEEKMHVGKWNKE